MCRPGIWSILTGALILLPFTLGRPDPLNSKYLAELKDELAAVGVPHNDELWESVSIEDKPVKGYEEQSLKKATGSEEVGTTGDDYSSDIEVPESSDMYISGVQPVSSVESIKNAQTVKRIEPVVNVQELARAEEIKSIEPVSEIQEVLSMTPVISKQEVKDIKEIKSIQEIANLIPLDSEKAKMFIKQEGLDGSPVVGYSGKPAGEDYSSDLLPSIPAEPKLPAVTPTAAPRGYSGKASISAAAPPVSGKPEGLLEPIERDIEKEDKIDKLLDDEYARGLSRLKGIEQVKAKHKLARAERIKKLDEVKRMLEVKSIEEVRQMNGIKSINEVKSMQEVTSKKEITRKHEVKSKQEVLSKHEVKSMEPVTSIDEIKKIYELTDEQADRLKALASKN